MKRNNKLLIFFALLLAFSLLFGACTSPAVFDGITVSGSVTATNYVNANAVDLTGITVTKHYSDETSAPVDLLLLTTNWNEIKSSAGEKTLTLSYTIGEITKTAQITVTVSEISLPPEPVFTEITISGSITATNYVNAASVDLTGITVTKRYDNGETDTVPLTSLTTNWDEIKSSAGEKTLTVSYTEDEITATAQITVTVSEIPLPPEPILTKITVSGSITATNYLNAPSVDLTGITITKHYDNGETDTVPLASLTTDWDEVKTVAGVKLLTLYYTEDEVVTKTVQIPIVVVAPSIDSISVSGSITATNYINAPSVNLTGITVAKHYNNGDSETVPLTSLTTNWNEIKSSAGVKTLTVSYTESSITKSVTVVITVKDTSLSPVDITSFEELLNNLPKYSGTPYIAINGNVPFFATAEITETSFERYSPLDSLGRCGVAFACVGQDIMPTEPRGSISSVKPTGWQSVSYSIVDGGSLYNRSHLLGFQLTGENANRQNLITGTRYMNWNGMESFESMVADYVKETDNHVMYRVTPIFLGNNLLATGVLMEAMSVEDNGDGILFCVYCPNVQPGIIIDYSNGDNRAENPEEQPVYSDEVTYILNTSSKKFHRPTCSSVGQIKETNKTESTLTREELIAQGYVPCGNCKP